MGHWLVVQRLGLHPFTLGCLCLIPGWGTKILHASCYSQKLQKLTK